jgi:hypothetical protein
VIPLNAFIYFFYSIFFSRIIQDEDIVVREILPPNLRTVTKPTAHQIKQLHPVKLRIKPALYIQVQNQI